MLNADGVCEEGLVAMLEDQEQPVQVSYGR